MSFLTSLINGLSLGSIYAIIAIGYTMVYGIAKMLNFAHGDVIMVGAYVAFSVITTLTLPTGVGILASIVGCMLLGMTIEKVAYKPLRHATSSLAVLITAIGVSYFLQNMALLIFGSNPKMFTSIVPFAWQRIQIGDFMIQTISVICIIVSIVLVALLQTFINKTRPGQAMLACAQDRGAASLMGISVDKTISLTFAIGSAMAGIAGVLLCSAYPTLSPYTGSMPGIKAFVAAVFGGIGSIPGAMIGGLLLGIIEILGKTYISSQLSDAIVFSVLIIVLLVKPTGLMGKVIQEKV
ncbi:MAG: branched-chain amino acid ABC transporter permease [Lachnospiraceae bacterium]|nr:branched-chain amino acid ABC transporter permease [Lachnospiraceae bacterium]